MILNAATVSNAKRKYVLTRKLPNQMVRNQKELTVILYTLAPIIIVSYLVALFIIFKGYKGGCATDAELYPRWKKQKFEAGQLAMCEEFCYQNQGCQYYEFCSSGNCAGDCHIHYNITKGNGWPGVYCYKMKRDNAESGIFLSSCDAAI